MFPVTEKYFDDLYFEVPSGRNRSRVQLVGREKKEKNLKLKSTHFFLFVK